MSFSVIDLEPHHCAQVASLWADGWHQAHAKIVPDALVALRTADSFAQRLQQSFAQTRIAIDGDRVLGMCITHGDELYQIYVHTSAQGKGIAQALLTDAEDKIRQNGHDAAWLACAIGNHRAAQFYRKCGWLNAGVQSVDLDTSKGVFALEIIRFEKPITGRTAIRKAPQ